MNNRIKNIFILSILILFLLMIEIIPVSCSFLQVTGIYCPSCGMTRAFHSIINFDIISAIEYNILSIPLFLFLLISIIALLYEIIMNKWSYIPHLISFLSNKLIIAIIVILILLSIFINNLYGINVLLSIL